MIIKKLRKSTTAKKIIIIGGVVLVLVAIPLTYIYAFNGNLFGWQASKTVINNHSQDTIDYNPATPEQQKAGDQTKSGSNDTLITPSASTGSDKKDVQVTITAADQNGSTLQIRTLVNAVENTGTCTLTITSTGRPTVTETANIQSLANTSTCQGFDIPISELSVGTWNILVGFSSDTLTGSATMNKVIR